MYRYDYGNIKRWLPDVNPVLIYPRPPNEQVGWGLFFSSGGDYALGWKPVFAVPDIHRRGALCSPMQKKK